MAVVHVTGDTFEQEVLKAEGKVLVDFWAGWCGPCQMLGPVIEKDLTAGKMAEETDADMLIILTSVEKVKIHMGRADEKDLGEITVDQAKKYMEEGHFGVYNMLPKFNASVNFVEGREGRSALITSYDKLNEALEGKTGTVIR